MSRKILGPDRFFTKTSYNPQRKFTLWGYNKIVINYQIFLQQEINNFLQAEISGENIPQERH
jgi:hypothetical protein